MMLDATQLRRFPKHDDYKHTLKLVAEAKCAEIRKYEDEFKAQWTGPRELPKLPLVNPNTLNWRHLTNTRFLVNGK
jgi:hypothetical protein